MRLLFFTLWSMALWAQPRAITLTKEVPGGVVNLGTVATPTVDNDTGTYSLPVTLTFSDATSGAAIWTCSNVGSNCTPTALTNPVTVSVTDTHVCAVAKKTDYTNSAAKCATITATPACTSPTGALFTESFGDSSSSCWSGGPSTCNRTWTVGAGTGETIIASPGTPPSNSACTNSLQYVNAAGDYITSSVSTILPSTSIDWYAYVYFTAEAFHDEGHTRIVSFERDPAPTNTMRAQLLVYKEFGNFYFRGYGSTLSAQTALPFVLNTWYKVRLHLEAGTDASYVSVNDGTPATFTQEVMNVNYVAIGDAGYTWTAAFGAMWIN